jgi:hypothetical protein
MGFEKVKVTIKDLEECLAYVVSNHSRWQTMKEAT